MTVEELIATLKLSNPNIQVRIIEDNDVLTADITDVDISHSDDDDIFLHCELP